MYLAKIIQSRFINLVFHQSLYFDKKKLLIYIERSKIFRSMSNDLSVCHVVTKDCEDLLVIDDVSTSKPIEANSYKKHIKTTNNVEVEVLDNNSSDNDIKIERHLPKRVDKGTHHKISETSQEKNFKSTPTFPSPIVIDIDDYKENKGLMHKPTGGLNCKPETASSSKMSTINDMGSNELDNFLVFDTLPSPILIDIDHPHKYKKSRNTSNFNTVDYKIFRNKSLCSKKKKMNNIVSNDQSVEVIDVDDTPIKCENLKSGEKQKFCQSSRIRQLSCNCRKSSSCDITCKNGFCSLDKRKRKSKKHKINNNIDDDIIFETTVDKVGRSFLPLQVEKDVNFFRNHLLQSSKVYQKRKYSTDSTHDDWKNKKGTKYKGKNNKSDLCSKEEKQNLSENDNLDSKNKAFVDFNSDNSVLLVKENSNITATSNFSAIEIDNISYIVLEDSEADLKLKSEMECSIDVDFTSKNIKVKEIKEISDDSVLSTDKFVFENASMEIEAESDNEVNDIIVGAETSDFVPLSSFTVRNLEVCPPISGDIKIKRSNYEALRKWELTGLGQNLINSSQNIDGTLFTLLSYNVLSQQLLWDNKYLYQNCNPDYLEWTYRWPLFQHEVKHLQPDIITLQEIQGNYYHTHYLPWFKYLGYNCIFKKRTNEKVDGCAIIYNAKKFDLIEENSVEFYQPNEGNILNRDNVGLILRLTPTSSYSPFCVATTHILFNPKRTDIKLAQMTVFLAELDRICYKTEENGRPKYCPVILTGDFNAEPYSPLLTLIRQGSLTFSNLQRNKYSDEVFGTKLIPPSLGLSDYCQHKVLSNGRYLEKLRGELFSLKDKRKIEEELIKLYHSDRMNDKNKNDSSSSSNIIGGVSSGILNHAFNFKSVYYHKLNRLNRAPEVTTFQNYWTTVDYIFYSRILRDSIHIEGPLKLIGRYGLLGAMEASSIGSLPSDICPSDHYPLAAQFLLKHN